MPRHTDEQAGLPLHAYLPHAERPPRFVTPEPVWVLDSYRVKRWYYRSAPAVGDKVMYLQDGFGTRITRVNHVAIYFADGSVMRRPFLAGRVLACLLPRALSLIPRPRPRPVLRRDVSTVWV